MDERNTQTPISEVLESKANDDGKLVIEVLRDLFELEQLRQTQMGLLIALNVVIVLLLAVLIWLT